MADGGKLRLLAQAGPSRHPLYPSVPTTAEYGLAGVRMDTWFGLVAPAKTPDAIVIKLDGAVAAILREQDFNDKLAKIGCAPAYKPHAEFAAYISAELNKWGQLLPAVGIPKID